MRVCAVWSEPLLVAHTTLLEIACLGSYTIVKQPCYFAKECDLEFNKKAHKGKLIFIATLCTLINVDNFDKKAQNLFQNVGGYFLKIAER